ncbi:MAG TPA: translocase [Anaeromyxobacter sp.]
MITDLAVVLFVAILVVGGLYVPRIGDALGRLVRRDREPPPGSRGASRDPGP